MKKIGIYVILIAVLGAFMLSLVVNHSIKSPDAFFSTKKSINVDLSDLYSSVGRRALKKDYCNDILIISTDNSNRRQISAIIDALNYMGAKVIGLDLLFQSKQFDDNYLISSIASSDNIVLPVGLWRDNDSLPFSINDTCYFNSQLNNKSFGAVNLDGNSIRSTVRNFKYSFNLKDDEYIDAFATAIIKLYSKKIKFDKELSAKEQRINFHSNEEFEILSWDEIITKDSIPTPIFTHENLIKDKIILLGQVDSRADMHTTPISVEMPGVFIHAHILATILGKKEIIDVSKSVNYIIAVIITFVFCGFVFYVRENIKHIGRMLIRIVQFTLMIIFFYIGSILYIKYDLFVDFSLTLLMLGFSTLMLDIASGLYWIYLLVINRIKK